MLFCTWIGMAECGVLERRVIDPSTAFVFAARHAACASTIIPWTNPPSVNISPKRVCASGQPLLNKSVSGCSEMEGYGSVSSPIYVLIVLLLRPRSRLLRFLLDIRLELNTTQFSMVSEERHEICL